MRVALVSMFGVFAVFFGFKYFGAMGLVFAAVLVVVVAAAYPKPPA